jgi:hypothetical protein
MEALENCLNTASISQILRRCDVSHPSPLIPEGTAIKPERLVAAAREPIHGLVRSYSPDS